MIKETNGLYELHTAHTSYGFRITESSHAEHLYYGRRIHLDAACSREKQTFLPGNTISYSKDFPNLTLEDLCLEMSSYGKGDIREPLISLVFSDGSRTSDFVFARAEIDQNPPALDGLPSSYSDSGEVDHLTLFLKERSRALTLELHYFVYEECDVITRTVRLFNETDEPVRIDRLMSLQLDFDDSGYIFTTFGGAWAREMGRHDTLITAGKHVNSSMTGSSSSRANPFVMLSRPGTTEETGECFGFNLVYSGNHYEACEVSSFGKMRLTAGINPASFEYVLESGASFDAPEAVMTYSCGGFNEMSHHLHDFIRHHIVRGSWRDKVRPVLLNSWEAAYFKINEQKLLRLAKAAKDVGAELFVMDDGWFSGRNDDTSSLGDWAPDEKKLPGGLAGISAKIRALGLDFGIWVEPEMISVNSELYRKHPDWVMQIPGRDHAEGRNQRILDLANPAVQDWLIGEMTRVLQSAKISYVKWDMNRIMSDVYSPYLDAAHQGETAHRYICGLYRCMKELTEHFPKILFEGCAAGGNRFDLGILSYFPQIWASDDTDAYVRAQMQYNYSYGYPANTYTAHVSDCPNHQTLRNTPLDTRYAVAAFGVLGYECNLNDLGKEELEAVREQIAQYKQWREVLQKGRFYRLSNTCADGFGGGASVGSVRACGGTGYGQHASLGAEIPGNAIEWCTVSDDHSRACAMLMQGLVTPNSRFASVHLRGLDPEAQYHLYSDARKHNIKEFGGLVNTVTPVHIKPGSAVHELASKFIKMDGEAENVTAYGDTLMYAGVKLKQGFAATGYSDQVRFFPDFASRLYWIEQIH